MVGVADRLFCDLVATVAAIETVRLVRQRLVAPRRNSGHRSLVGLHRLLVLSISSEKKPNGRGT